MRATQHGIAVLLVFAFGLQTTVSASDLSWRDLQRVRPGTELRVHGHGDRVFVAADESALYVLNLVDPQLPRNVKSSLKDWVKDNAHTLPALMRGATITGLSHDVRIGSDGVFVGDQKIGELNAVFQTLARTSVAPDAVATKHRGMSISAKIAIVGGIVAGIWLIHSVGCSLSENCS